jgi:hypothetical protein
MLFGEQETATEDTVAAPATANVAKPEMAGV